MIKKTETDFSKPLDEIDYETKKRKKRRRGEESTEPRKKKAPPYKRETLNLLVEDEYDPFDEALSEYAEQSFEYYSDTIIEENMKEAIELGLDDAWGMAYDE